MTTSHEFEIPSYQGKKVIFYLELQDNGKILVDIRDPNGPRGGRYVSFETGLTCMNEIRAGIAQFQLLELGEAAE